MAVKSIKHTESLADLMPLVIDLKRVSASYLRKSRRILDSTQVFPSNELDATYEEIFNHYGYLTTLRSLLEKPDFKGDRNLELFTNHLELSIAQMSSCLDNLLKASLKLA
jgi:hypothetical protein